MHVRAQHLQVDPLRDEAEAYARRLEAAGVQVELKRYKGHFHNSMCAAAAQVAAPDERLRV